ncbi:nuclear receptor corepressor 2 [Nowakowskiella sp. JEL0078]|nr:nuclear receptor corepressor 2 [Nowakowskiella sp. JEL0078]
MSSYPFSPPYRDNNFRSRSFQTAWSHRDNDRIAFFERDRPYRVDNRQHPQQQFFRDEYRHRSNWHTNLPPQSRRRSVSPYRGYDDRAKFKDWSSERDEQEDFHRHYNYNRKLSGEKFLGTPSERGSDADYYRAGYQTKHFNSRTPPFSEMESAGRDSEEKNLVPDDDDGDDIGARIEAIDSDISKYEELLKSIRDKNINKSTLEHSDSVIQHEMQDIISENLVSENSGKIALKHAKATSLSKIFTFGVPKSNIWASEPHEPDKSSDSDSADSLSELNEIIPGIPGIRFEKNLTETIYTENWHRAHQSTLQELQLNPTPRIFKEYQEYDFYAQNIKTHDNFRPLIAEIIQKNNDEMQAKRVALQLQFKEYMDEWMVTTEKLDVQARKQNANLVVSSTVSLPLSTSIPSSNLLGPTFVQSNGTDTGRVSRRQTHVRDVARTEAEFEQILFNLSIEAKNEDSTRLAKEPSQIISPTELQQYKDYINTNNLVADPESTLREFHNHIDFCWTDSERHMFRTKLIQYGKNFHKIASAIPNKSTSDCVHYYYREKYACNFKALLQQKNAAALLSSTNSNASRKRSKRTSEGLKGEDKKRRIDDEDSVVADDARKARAELRAQQKDPKHTSSSSSPITPISPFLEEPTIATTNIQPLTTREKCGPWSEEEKRRLRNGIAVNGRNFALVAAVVMTRSEDQCRRYSYANKRAFPLPPLAPDEHDDNDEMVKKRKPKVRLGNELNEDEERKRKTTGLEKLKREEVTSEVIGADMVSPPIPPVEAFPIEADTQPIPSSLPPILQVQPPVTLTTPLPTSDALLTATTINSSSASIVSSTGRQQQQQQQQQQSRRTVSYWSVSEKDVFLSSLEKYGRNWEAIAKEIGSKSAIQARNYYHNFRLKLNLDKRLEENGHSTEEEKPQFSIVGTATAGIGAGSGVSGVSSIMKVAGVSAVEATGVVDTNYVSPKIEGNFLDHGMVQITSSLQNGHNQSGADKLIQPSGSAMLSYPQPPPPVQIVGTNTQVRLASPVQLQGYVVKSSPSVTMSSATNTTTTTTSTMTSAPALMRVQQFCASTPEYKPNEHRTPQQQQNFYQHNGYYLQPGVGVQSVVVAPSLQHQQQYYDRQQYPVPNPQLPAISQIPVGSPALAAKLQTTEVYPVSTLTPPPLGVAVDPLRTLPSLKSWIGGVVSGEEWGGRKEDGLRLAPLQDVDDGCVEG